MDAPRKRDYSRNAGLISCSDVADEVWIAGAVIVTMNENGTFGTYFMAEDIDELPTPSTQLDLGQAIATAWATASLCSGDSDE